MTSRIAQWTLDVQDVPTMAEFWSQALGYRAVPARDGSAKLLPPDEDGLYVWLQPSAGRKSGKNRNHPDLVADDPAAEVERLLRLGATHADVGQTEDDGFIVLADPEGNEFCVLDGQPSR
jgi:catechol-2,3-dioxygenase